MKGNTKKRGSAWSWAKAAVWGLCVLALVFGFALAGCSDGSSPGGENPGGENPGGSNNYYGEYYPAETEGILRTRAHIYIFFGDKEIPYFSATQLTGFSVTVGEVQQTLSVDPGYPGYPWVEGSGSNPNRIGIWFDNVLPATGDIKVSYDGSNSTVTAKGVPTFTNVAVERK